MEESLTEAQLKEQLLQAHRAGARLPIEEKLRILDELQETALVFADLRARRRKIGEG